jgi:hypothetical protein
MILSGSAVQDLGKKLVSLILNQCGCDIYALEVENYPINLEFWGKILVHTSTTVQVTTTGEVLGTLIQSNIVFFLEPAQLLPTRKETIFHI